MSGDLMRERSPHNNEDDEFISEDEEEPEGIEEEEEEEEEEHEVVRVSSGGGGHRLLTRRLKIKPSTLTNSALKSTHTYANEVLTSARSPVSAPSSRGSSRASSRFLQDRINSAKRKHRKEMMNSVKALQRTVQDLREENRLLNRQVKRQELELNRLEGAKGELPTLLHAHNEEVRVLKSQIKRLTDTKNDLDKKLKHRDSIIFKMREASRAFRSDAKARDSDDVDKLRAEADDLSSQLERRDEENKNLRHKLSLMEKSFKQQLSNERSKQSALNKKLEIAEKQIQKLKLHLQEKDKLIHRNNIYARRLPNQALSSQKSNNPNSRLSGASSMSSLAHLVDREETGSSTQSSSSPATYSVKSKSNKQQSDVQEDQIEDLSSWDPNNGAKRVKSPPLRRWNTREKSEQDETADRRNNELAQNQGKDDSPSRSKIKSDFRKTLDFFERRESLIGEKSQSNGFEETEVHKSREGMNEDEKVALWMPKGMSSSRKNSTASNSTTSNPGAVQDSMTKSPQRNQSLNESDKAGLLAKLQLIDEQDNSGVYEKSADLKSASNLGYSPSFGPPKSRDQPHINFSHDQSAGFHDKSNNGLLDSPAASVASRKSNLMKELFGEDTI